MIPGCSKIFSSCDAIPKRYILGVMGFFGIVNAYLMRAVLSVAIIEMVNPINSTEIVQEDVCPNFDNVSSNSESDKQGSSVLYDWNEEIQGILLGSFYWGYVISHIPGGLLAEKFGGKHTFGFGILSTAIFTMITPFVVKLGDWPWLMVFRIFVGLGEGTTFPAVNVLLSKWVPISERSTIATLVYAGLQVGNVVGNAAGGLIISYTQSWEYAFYIFGCSGVVWFVFWTLLVFSEPSSHPYITEHERNYLEKELGSTPEKKYKTPWKAMLTSLPVWALILAGIGFDWGIYTMLNDLPKYMKTILKFNVAQSGIWSSTPYIVMWIFSMICAWMCDKLIIKKYIKISTARKLFTLFSSVGSGIFLMAASYSKCNRELTITFFTLGVGFMGASYCGTKVNSLDLSPNFAGTLTAVVNGIGALCGIATPYLAGILTENQTLSEWRLVFWISFVILGVTAVIFIIFGSGEEQWWNTIEEKNNEIEKVEKNEMNAVETQKL